MKPYELEWSFVHEITGKYIIADCGNKILAFKEFLNVDFIIYYTI